MGSPSADDTVAARWKTVQGQASGLVGRPSSTIKPRPREIGSTARGALHALTEPTPDDDEAAVAGLRLGPVLGEGGMGIVHRATQTTVGRDVAVKSVRPARRGPGPTLKLLQEAWTAGQLEHPNIIPVYDIATGADDEPLIVLRRIEGESWSELLHDEAQRQQYDEGEDPLQWHLGVLLQVCNAIAFAHSRHVLHLDLKPDNVMVGRHGEVYVVDWGIAMALRDDGSGRLSLARDCDEIIGTPHYMAPEMLEGDGARLSPATDVYLLGAILFEILAGRPPHDGETMMEVLHAVMMTTPRLPEDAPGELAQICMRAMAHDPAERYADVAGLRDDIRRFLRHRDSMRLTEEAQQRLAALRARLEQAEGGEPVSPHVLFGPVRFGFEQALASWAGNTVAQAGLREAFESVVDYELRHGDPQVAAAVASEAPELSAQLAARVEDTQAQARADRDALAALGRDNDPTIGMRTRVFVFGLLGLSWTLLPAIKYLVIGPTDDTSLYVAPAVVSLLGLGVLAIWARDSLTRTRINRVAVASCAIALLAHPIAAAGGSMMGLDGTVVLTNMALLWAVVLAVIAVTFDLRLLATAVGYLAAFFVAAADPSRLFLGLSVANLLFVGVLFVLWRPERLRPPPPDTTDGDAR